MTDGTRSGNGYDLTDVKVEIVQNLAVRGTGAAVRGLLPPWALARVQRRHTEQHPGHRHACLHPGHPSHPRTPTQPPL